MTSAVPTDASRASDAGRPGRKSCARAIGRRIGALLGAGVLLAGCGSADTGGGGRVVGDTLTVVSLLPLSGPEAPVARDLLRGQKLALAECGGRFASRSVTMTAIDDSVGDGDRVGRAAARATRLALSDSQAIAVIGSLGFESAAVSVPLLNAAGLLHVSPTVGYGGFTERRAPAEPQRWYPSGQRTFHPGADDERQAAVTLDAIRAASGLRRPRILVEREAGPQDLALADAITGRAREESARVVDHRSRADAVVYVGDDPVAAQAVAEGLGREAPRALVVYGDDLTRVGFEDRLSPAAARRAVFVSRAPRPGSTPELRRFRREYVTRFGSDPGPYAALGHAAMWSVLRDGIARAGARAGERDRVAEAYLESAPELPASSAFRVRVGRRVYLPVLDQARG
jgi:branched-chain amino acid transport system substrate-binding protein